jgi:hypothetical protein
METVFSNQFVYTNPSLRGNVSAHPFPRNGSNVTILNVTPGLGLGFFVLICESDLYDRRPVSGFCEHGNEPSGQEILP